MKTGSELVDEKPRIIFVKMPSTAFGIGHGGGYRKPIGLSKPVILVPKLSLSLSCWIYAATIALRTRTTRLVSKPA